MPLLLISLVGSLLVGAAPQNAAPPRKPTPTTASQTSGITVTIRSEPEVAKATFTLGDIADITGTNKPFISQIAEVEVGTSPLPGLTRPIFMADVLARLRYNHIDPTGIQIVFPPSVRIRRGGAEISTQELVKVAQESLKNAIKARNLPVEDASIETIQMPVKLFVAAGKTEYLAGAPHGQLESGTVSVPVTVLVDGKPAKSVEVAFRIKRTAVALMAKRPLDAHTVLTEDDLTLGSVEVSPGAPIPFADKEALIGKRTVRAIAQGGVLNVTLVENPPAVVLGAEVTLEVTAGGIRITAPGLARSTASIGERVRVYAKDTKKELTGIVIDAKTVRVEELP